jgi:hypothetical protein
VSQSELVLVPSDYIRQLVDGFWTRERPEGWDRPFIAHHAALLDQLENTLTGSTTGNDTVRTTAGSRPAGRVDVLAFLERIQSESLRLADELEVDTLPLRPRLRRIAGKLGLQPEPVVRGWWVTARVLTSFDAPAFIPNVPCPNELCERRGTLRVKVAQRTEECMGVCVECHQVWDGPYFGVFAQWIRWASDHLGAGHTCSDCKLFKEELARRALLRTQTRYATSRR